MDQSYGYSGGNSNYNSRKEENETYLKSYLNDNIMIPELPEGCVLSLNLIESWSGGNDEFGIRGIEIFNSQGSIIRPIQTSCNGEIVCGKIDKIFFISGPSIKDKSNNVIIKKKHNDNYITIKAAFKKTEIVSMIRIYNFNKSRVDMMLGVRFIEIRLDNLPIFSGEISTSFGLSDGNGTIGDTILFTTSNEILEEVRKNDVSLKYFEMITNDDDKYNYKKIANGGEFQDVNVVAHRPTTAESEKMESINQLKRLSISDQEKKMKLNEMIEDDEVIEVDGIENCIKTKILHLELLNNWGCQEFIGLTGLQFLGENGKAIDTSEYTIKCSTGDDISLQNLLNKKNLTLNKKNMWLIAYDNEKNTCPCITVTFKNEVYLYGLSIWNYNESEEMSYAGVKYLRLFINGKKIENNILLRKGPGFVYYDYVQDILFNVCRRNINLFARPNTKSIVAFVYQFRLLSTWGDDYYIGLNGIELTGRDGNKIKLKAQNIACFPESVNILPNVVNDPRVSTNLILDEPQNKKTCDTWLTPLLPNNTVRIFVIFDFPTYISEITIYNYSKTPERGVKDIVILADDLIVFSGEVEQSKMGSVGILKISLRE
uniref:KATNIP domain-containing protein n=1 Tax=Strongyloides stercoralis TaxID=6248 RepID=A0A0K0ECN5_STRER